MTETPGTYEVTPVSESMTYRATCRTCGHVTMLVVDNPARQKQVAKDMAAAVRCGDVIDRVESEWVRTAQWQFCECHATRNPPNPISLWEESQ